MGDTLTDDFDLDASDGGSLPGAGVKRGRDGGAAPAVEVQVGEREQK